LRSCLCVVFVETVVMRAVQRTRAKIAARCCSVRQPQVWWSTKAALLPKRALCTARCRFHLCVCTCRNTAHCATTRACGVRVSVFRCDLTNVSATCNVWIKGNDDAERAERANGIVLTLLDAPSPSLSHARPTRASGDDEKARVSRREIASIGNVFSAAQRVGFTRSEPA
jgi:hypothetical protein